MNDAHSTIDSPDNPPQTDQTNLYELEQARAAFHDPLSSDDFLKLIEVFTLRQITDTRIRSYEAVDLDTLVRLGRKDEAIWRAYHRSSLAMQVQGLLAIGETLRELEQLDAAYLAEIDREVRKTRNDFMNGYPYWKLSELYAKSGDLEAAQNVIKVMKDSCNGYNARLSYVEAIAEAGDFAEALRLAETRFGKGDASSARSRILNIQARKMLDDPSALFSVYDVIYAIDLEYFRQQLLTELAVKLWGSGLRERSVKVLAEVRELAKSAAGTAIRDEAYANLARAYLAIGDIESARRIVNDLQAIPRVVYTAEAPVHSVLLGEFADALQKAGWLDEANSYYQQVFETPQNRDAVLAQLTIRFAKLNDLTQAREMLAHLSTGEAQGKALAEIANIYCRAGRMTEGAALFKESRTALEAAGERRYFLDAAFALASAFSSAGAQSKAQAILQVARSAAAQVDEDWEISWVFAHLAQHYVRAGDTNSAQQLVEAGLDDKDQAYRRCLLIVALAENGYSDLANSQMDRIEARLASGQLNVDHLDWDALADAFIATGRFGLASKYLTEFVPLMLDSGDEFLDQTLTEFADKFLQANDLNGAIEVSIKITSEYERCRSLRYLIKRLCTNVRIDDAEHVLNLIQNDRIGSVYQEARAQIILGKALHQSGQVERGLNLLRQVLNNTAEFEHLWPRLRILAHLGAAFTLVGDAEGERAAYAALDTLIARFEAESNENSLRYGFQAGQVQYKYLVSLIEGSHLEQAREKLDSIPRDDSFDTWFFAARRDLSNAYAHKGEYAAAFTFLDLGFISLSPLDQYISGLCAWMRDDIYIPKALWAQALEKVVILLGHARPDWQTIAAAINLSDYDPL